jgi:hypothetical protein
MSTRVENFFIILKKKYLALNQVIFSIFRVLRVLFALVTMDTQLPENFPLVAKIKGEAVTLGLYEAFLEAAPQFILQLSIVLRTGFISE